MHGVSAGSGFRLMMFLIAFVIAYNNDGVKMIGHHDKFIRFQIHI
jgi:hypothetical protein